jgi:predicted choloylglycine hydrolase
VKVIGLSDCMWGLLDGINEDGLVVALSFGGRQEVGEGFGVPLVLRYVLETCTRTDEACAALARVPVHMSYNVTVVDRSGDFSTVFLVPGQEPATSVAWRRRPITRRRSNGTSTLARRRRSSACGG